MLTPYKINAYCEEFKPEWACTMPVGCPPEDVLVPSEHPFFRLASQMDSYTADDFKFNNVAIMRPLTLINTLEYYDVPQILVAADATGTNYLCTLYKNDAEDGYLYLGVQISEPRLMAFVGGQLDLRDAYVHPEVENALYIVTAKQEVLTATTLLQPQDISEDMLPEAGYFYDASDLADEAEPQTDTYQLEVPAHDRITFSTLISRMGWRALSLRNVLKGKAAIF